MYSELRLNLVIDKPTGLYLGLHVLFRI